MSYQLNSAKTMILQTGWFKPTKEQVKIAKSVGDSSFTACLNQDKFSAFSQDLIPTPSAVNDSWDNFIKTLIFLKMKNVEPHTDPYVGNVELEEHDVFASLFWVLDARKPLHLQVGPHSASLKAGSWVLFADTVTHSVISDATWVGCATQVLVKIPFDLGKSVGVLSDLSQEKIRIPEEQH